jgi:hypothetical protein
LLNDYIRPGHLRLLVQSNFNVPGGEPHSAAAHRFLRDCDNQGVELIYGPFGREAYQRLIARTDIMLIPYDARNYAARSSGIFAEAVAAGIPSVIFSGTWMASVVEPDRQAYLIDLFESGEGAEARLGTKVCCRLIDSAKLPIEAAMSGLIVELPRVGTHGLIRFSIDDDAAAFVHAYVTNLNRAGTPIVAREQTVPHHHGVTRVPFKIDGASKAWIRVRALAGRVPIGRIRIHLDVYELARDVPLGSGSAITGHASGGFVAGLREILDHYEHYRVTAGRQAETLRHLYDPAALIDHLVLGKPLSRPSGAIHRLAGSLRRTDHPTKPTCPTASVPAPGQGFVN